MLKSTKNTLISGIFGLSLVGCVTAKQPEDGQVAVVIDNSSAYVRIADREIRQGDKVDVYRQECISKMQQAAGSRSDRGGGHQVKTCTSVKVGEGVAAAMLNPKYATVEFSAGTTVEEGDTVVLQPVR